MTFTFRLVRDDGVLELRDVCSMSAGPDFLVLYSSAGAHTVACDTIRHVDVFRTGG